MYIGCSRSEEIEEYGNGKLQIPVKRLCVFKTGWSFIHSFSIDLSINKTNINWLMVIIRQSLHVFYVYMWIQNCFKREWGGGGEGEETKRCWGTVNNLWELHVHSRYIIIYMYRRRIRSLYMYILNFISKQRKNMCGVRTKRQAAHDSWKVDWFWPMSMNCTWDSKSPSKDVTPVI